MKQMKEKVEHIHKNIHMCLFS